MGTQAAEATLKRKLQSGLQACWRARILVVEVIIAAYYFKLFFYISLYEQFYYYKFGLDALHNTSFVFPNGSFCVKSDLINNFTGSSDAYVKDEVQSNHLTAFGHLAHIVPEIIATVIIGPLTDKYGRKIGIVLPILGTILAGIAYTIIVWFDTSPYFMLLVQGLVGFFGGHLLLTSTIFSYIADVSSARWRTLRLGILAATASFGGGAGELLSGYWLDTSKCHFIVLYLFYTTIAGAVLIYTLIIPDSLSKEERKKISDEHPKGVKLCFEGVRLYCGRLSLRNTWKLDVGTLVFIIISANISIAIHIDIYFLKALPFDFNPHQIGIYQLLRESSRGVASIVVLVALIVLRVNDIVVMILAVAIHVICNILMGLANREWQLYAVISIKGVELLAMSGAQGFLSKLINSENQGALFSIVSSLSAFSILVANIFWPFMFPLALKLHMRSGSMYIAMGIIAFAVLPMLLSLIFLKTKEKDAKEEKDDHCKHEHRDEHSDDAYSGDVEDSDEEQPFLDKKQS